MHDPDERDELLAVVFDEKKITIALLEFRRVAHLHRLSVDRSAKHANRVGGTGTSLDRVIHAKRYVGNNVPLRALSDPLRTSIGNRTLENYLCATNELIERRRNHSRRLNGKAQSSDE